MANTRALLRRTHTDILRAKSAVPKGDPRGEAQRPRHQRPPARPLRRPPAQAQGRHGVDVSRADLHLGHEKEFTLLFHEGKSSNLHVSQVSDQVLLIITFGRETQVGKVRLYTQRAIEVLRPIFEGSDEENEALSVDADYEATAGKAIDDLFADLEGQP